MIWRHNGDNQRWEIGYLDIDRNTFVVQGFVADEVIDDAVSPKLLAAVLTEQFCSIPPALKDKLEERVISDAKTKAKKTADRSAAG